MAAQDKICTVAFDEMKIKPSLSYDARCDRVEGLQDLGALYSVSGKLADHVLVFMVRGLFSKWKQPVAYYLSNSTVSKNALAEILKSVITAITNVGLIPKVLVCDQGSNNRACLAGVLGVTVDQPVLKMLGCHLYCFYDVPHLLKNVRNNLRLTGYRTAQGHLIQWQHIEQFHVQDSQLPIRLAPRLKQKHLKLPGFSSMNVRLAAQVLSHSVSRGISFMVSQNLLAPSAQLTADFCDRFDSLFNLFNSHRTKSQAKFNSGLTAANTEQWSMLTNMAAYIRNLQPASGSTTQPCLEGWIQNINALKLLFAELQPSVLLTYRLNQDFVENFFSQIRSKGGSRDHPDCQQLRGAFRDLQVDALLSVTDNTNCESDITDLLFGLDGLQKSARVPVDPPSVSSDAQLPSVVGPNPSTALFSDHDYLLQRSNEEFFRALENQAANVITYISGFVVRKVKEKLCACCQALVVADSCILPDPSHEFIRMKDYVQAPGKGLVVPSSTVVALCTASEKIFNQVIDSLVTHANVKQTLLNHMLTQNVEFVNCVQCSSKSRILAMYVTIRLHHSLRLHNREVESSGARGRSRKHVKLSS